MDSMFLANVNALIQKYIDADFQDNLEEMFKSIKNLELIVSPKIEDMKAEHMSIMWIRDNMGNIFVYDNQTGKIRGTNPKNMNAVKKVLDETYRSILMKLEDQKIYTGETSDKNKAMSQFGGS